MTRVETLPALPALGGLYARGLASSGRIAVRRTVSSGAGDLVLPDVTYRVAGVDTSVPDVAAHLERYRRVVGEPAGGTTSAGNPAGVPAGFLHVLAFPLATAVMVRGDFPLPLLGLVHVENSAAVLRPVRLGDQLEVRAHATNLRPHRRGAQVDLVTEVTVPGEGLAYRGVSTYLAKGVDLPDTSSAPGTEPDARGEWVPPLPTARWSLPAGTGRAYAAVSGDRNPIHTSALGAKAFGFPRTIAHGMYTAARALAEVGTGRGETYDWTVSFAKPVLLPSTVDVAIRPSGPGGGFTYQAWSGRSGTLHLTGAVTPRS
ncbi:MaoC/PaaZ C-terminal domain-containing protein [Oerskovia flava]|uniref:MaoC/PaaZ C-terminal domain-containing protein n=1 Tax=Oerskovia flava TaxID=2986422 RepID=UPI00223F41A2|nr:MaoC/PaaZ C-terminal domain-containing protein [Oerskovia sp. JB1-3-2]